MKTQENQDIEMVLENIFQSINDEEKIKSKIYLSDRQNAILFEKIFKDGSLNIEHYHLYFVSAQKRLGNGILKEKGIRSHQAIFLANNLSFVKAHLENIIVDKEGCSECADKSRRLIKMYFNHFEHNMPFIESLLPQKVLNTEKDAIDFFSAIYSLYYGQPKKYIDFLNK